MRALQASNLEMRRNLLLVGLVSVLATVACGPEEASLAARSPQDSWTTYESDDDGFVVSYPSDWFKAGGSLTPNLEDPREIFSAGTFALEPGPSECAQFAGHAMQNMGSHDALVSFQESSGRLEDASAIDLPEMPFTLETGYPTEARDCLVDPTPFTDRLIPFRYGNRSFYAYVAWGEDASSSTRSDILKILDSFKVSD